MIRYRVSFVLLVRDGFTGKPVAANAVRCFLDGAAFRPEYRAGGYFVFVNLGEGPHAVTLKSPVFQEETVALAGLSGVDEIAVTLRPAANYPFGRAVTRLALKLADKNGPCANRLIWVAACGAAREMKLAQDQTQPGDRALRLFYRGGKESEGYRFPDNYLIADGKNSEAVSIRSATDGLAALAAPLRLEHKRGAALYPAQAFRTDANGAITAFFKEAGEILLFDEARASVASAILKPGENTVEQKG